MIIATAGHVDHGKTRLVETLTGINTDRLKEEKERGLTIDLGFAYTNIDDKRVGFIDVPGHIRFISNMLAGVSTIDYALIVVAADDGVMPQTIEHVAILNLLGIDTGAVAITKTDRVSPTRIKEVSAEISTLLADTGLSRATIFPVSAVTGNGIDELRLAIKGAAVNLSTRIPAGNFRLSIDRVFSITGAGLVVTGSVVSGAVEVGDELFILPQGKQVRVRGLHRQDLDAKSAIAGDRCALNIVGADINRDDIQRGNWVCAVQSPTTLRADVLLRVPPGMNALKNGLNVHIHTAANHGLARVATLGQTEIKPSSEGLAQLVFRDPINLWAGDRLVIRDQAAAMTLGGGHVLDPRAPTRGRNKPQRLEELRALSLPAIKDRLTESMALHANGFDFDGFIAIENLTRSESEALVSKTDAITFGPWILTRARFTSHANEIFTTIENLQQKTPTSEGVTLQDLGDLFTRTPSAVLEAATDRLVKDNKIARNGTRLTSRGWNAELDGPEAALLARVKPILAADITRPPVIHDLAKVVGLPAATVDKLLSNCSRQGHLIKPTPNRFFLPEGIEALEVAVRSVANEAADGTFDVKAARDATGIGRNLCIEILEYFDRSGLTVRLGDRRKIRDN